MMTRAQCSCCGKRMDGLVAPESYIYCDYCVQLALRWMHMHGLLDGNPLAVCLGLHASSKARNLSPVAWHVYLAPTYYDESHFLSCKWPASGDYAYESLVDDVVESRPFVKDALDNL
jgi:hypothetical protein